MTDWPSTQKNVSWMAAAVVSNQQPARTLSAKQVSVCILRLGTPLTSSTTLKNTVDGAAAPYRHMVQYGIVSPPAGGGVLTVYRRHALFFLFDVHFQPAPYLPRDESVVSSYQPIFFSWASENTASSVLAL